MITLEQLIIRTTVPTLLFIILNFFYFQRKKSTKQKILGIFYSLITSFTCFYAIARTATYYLFIALQTPFPSANDFSYMAIESIPVYLILYVLFAEVYERLITVVANKNRLITRGIGFYLYTQYLVINYVCLASALSELEVVIHQIILCGLWYLLFRTQLKAMLAIYPTKRFSSINVCLIFEYIFVLVFWTSPVIISSDISGSHLENLSVMFGILAFLLFAFCVVIQKVMLQDAYHAYQEIQSINSDALTGLSTRAYFMRKAQQVLNSDLVKRGTLPVIVFFNIAEFKYFNELHGEREADALLVFIAKELRNEFGDIAGISRLADDHFAVITADRESIEQNILSINKKLNDHFGHVDLKAGIYIFSADEREVLSGLDKAKTACDSIRHDHTMVHKYFDENNARAMFLSHYVVENIERAVKEKLLHVFYQPITNVSTGEIISFEALVRWFDDSQGAMSPADFIPVLETHNLTYLADLYVLEQVCKDFRDQLDNGQPICPVAVNLSRKDFFLEQDIIESVNEIVDKYAIEHKFIKIEITESAFTEDNEHIRKSIHRLREYGYPVWMDDFGSGYSSLNMISTFEFDGIKLDMVFLQNLSTRGRYIIQSIVSSSKSLGLTVLMEGVETQEHYDFIKEIGCDNAQGFLLGKPEPQKKTN